MQNQSLSSTTTNMSYFCEWCCTQVGWHPWLLSCKNSSHKSTGSRHSTPVQTNTASSTARRWPCSRRPCIWLLCYPLSWPQPWLVSMDGSPRCWAEGSCSWLARLSTALPLMWLCLLWDGFFLVSVLDSPIRYIYILIFSRDNVFYLIFINLIHKFNDKFSSD